MTPLVSIIIPCFNAQAWLAETLRSALAQSHPRTEIIVVDDGSSDESVAVARQFEREGIRLACQENRGASAARNHGLALAGGSYVQFLDADDLLGPDKISLQLEKLASSPGVQLASGEWGRFFTRPEEAAFAAQPPWRDQTGLDFMVMHYHGGWMMPPSVWLSPRSLLAAAGPWREDLSLNDDGEYFCRVMLRSDGLVFCPGARVYHRSGLKQSLSGRKDAASLHSLALSIKANTDALLAAENSPRTKAACANAWQQLAYDIYPELPAEARLAEARARALGGSSRRLPGGRITRWTAALLGWRAGARIKRRLGQ